MKMKRMNRGHEGRVCLHLDPPLSSGSESAGRSGTMVLSLGHQKHDVHGFPSSDVRKTPSPVGKFDVTKSNWDQCIFLTRTFTSRQVATKP